MSSSGKSSLDTLRGFATDVRDALSGHTHDYTEGSLVRAVTVLAVPMILEMLMESVFILVDIYFLAKLGAEAVTAASLTEQALCIAYAVAVGLSMVATAMVARRVGEKRQEAAGRTAAQAVLLALLASLPFTVLGLLYAPEILRLMGASEAVVQLGTGNMMMMMGSNATIMLLYVTNGAFRGGGEPLIAMKVLWFANGINVLLDPCLIFGWGPFPEMGVLGAAVATTIGRGLGVALQMYLLFGGKRRLAALWAWLRPDWVVLSRMLKLSWWGIVQWLIATSSMTVVMRFVAEFGEKAVAGYAIGFRILIFVALPAWGLANAGATLVGQNLGAKNPERAERSVWLAALFNTAFLGVVTLFFFTEGDLLVKFFTSDVEVVRIGSQCLHLLGYSLMFYAVGLVICQAFNGAGDTATPTLLYFIVYWLFQIPMAWYLAKHTDWGLNGVFLTVSLAQGLLAPLSWLFFRRGTWKQRVV